MQDINVELVQGKTIMFLLELAEKQATRLEDLEAAHRAMPSDRAIEFAHRHGANIGSNIWEFLMDKAEELEENIKPYIALKEKS